MTIKIATVSRAATSLKAKLKGFDTNKDGELSDAELRAARKKDYPAGRTLQTLTYDMSANWWGGDGGPGDSNGISISDFKTAIDKGVDQLKLIDGYKGNATKPANKHDGKVTPAEIKNYSRGNGTLQHFAKTVVWYSDNK